MEENRGILAMKFSARPEKTYAVVVGIEKYDVGPAWNLDGPALDAARFIAWLRQKGVPANQIFAFLSPLDSNKIEIETMCHTLDVNSQEATGDLIRKTLAEILPAKRGDLLMTFWGGHGVVTETRERHLFYGNASAADKRNLIHESVLTAGKSRSYEGFPLQIGIVDACANHFEEMRMSVGITGDEIPANKMPARGIRQIVLFASATGEVAMNNNITRAGAFSQIIIEELAKSPDFPGDFATLNEKLKKHFEALRAEGKSRQTPVHYHFNDPQYGIDEIGLIPSSGRTHEVARRSGISVAQLRSIVSKILKFPSIAEESKRMRFLNAFNDDFKNAVMPLPTDAAASMEKMFSVALQEQLLPDFFEHLQLIESDTIAIESIREHAERVLLVGNAAAAFKGINIPETKLYRHYLATVPDPQLAPKGRTVDEMLEALVQMAPRSGSGPRISEFLERVNRPSPSDRLQEWLVCNSNGPTLAQVRTHLDVEQLEVPSRRPYLAVMVRTARLRPGEVPQIEAWLADGNDDGKAHWLVDCAADEEAMRSAVLGILSEARELTTSDLVVELLVPKQQFWLAPENWEINADEYAPASRLGNDYAVVLRWRERFSDSGRAKRQDWIKRAATIQLRVKEGMAVSWLWVSKEVFDFHTLRNCLLEKVDCGDCVGFQFVPEVNLDASKPDLITAALLGGAPFLVWFRQEPADWTRLRSDLELIAEVRFNDLPASILERRRRGDLGSITLFWDCPDHLPKPERGTSCPQRN